MTHKRKPPHKKHPVATGGVIAVIIAVVIAVTVSVVPVGPVPVPTPTVTATSTPTAPAPSPSAATESPSATPTASTPTDGAPALDGGPYDVVRVVDGDTVRVDVDGQEYALRLIGVDTPETVHPSRPVECWGPEASRLTHQILDGQAVTLDYDPTQDRIDRYDRLLVYVGLPDGTDVNKSLIEAGAAEEYTYRGNAYQRQGEYQAAEAAAREAGAGLWGNCPTP